MPPIAHFEHPGVMNFEKSSKTARPTPYLSGFLRGFQFFSSFFFTKFVRLTALLNYLHYGSPLNTTFADPKVIASLLCKTFFFLCGYVSIYTHKPIILCVISWKISVYVEADTTIFGLKVFGANEARVENFSSTIRLRSLKFICLPLTVKRYLLRGKFPTTAFELESVLTGSCSRIRRNQTEGRIGLRCFAGEVAFEH